MVEPTDPKVQAPPKNDKLPDFLTPSMLATLGGEVTWLCPPYFPLFAIVELNGPAKSGGKSTFVSRLVAWVTGADDLPFLGQVNPSPSDVVWFTEQPVSSLIETLTRAGLISTERLHLWLYMQHSQTSWTKAAVTGIQHAINVGAKLFIVDTLPQFALALEGASENDSGLALQAMSPLQRAVKEGICVVVVRHTGHRGDGDSPAGAGRGSTAYAGAVDVVMSISQPRKYRKPMPNVRRIAAQGRFSATPTEQLVIWDESGEYKLWDPDAGDPDMPGDAPGKILATLPASLESLAAVTSLSKPTLRKILVKLGAEARGKGTKGDPKVYYIPEIEDE